MLTRCTACGKPVCTTSYGPRRIGPDGFALVECGYCYARFSIRFETEGIPPWELDWKKPLYDAAVKGIPGPEGLEWLSLLGDYEDAAALLEKRTAEEAARREAMRLAEEARRQKILQAVLSFSEETGTVGEAEALARQLETLPEDALGQNERAVFEKKRKAVRYRNDLRRLETLRKEINTYLLPASLEDVLMELAPLADLPGAMDLIAAAQTRKSELLRLEKEQKEARERAERRRKRLKIILAAAAAGAMVLFVFLSLFVRQPRRLAEARNLAASDRWEESVSAYESLANSLLIRADDKSAAQEELALLRKRWAQSLLAEDRWEEALTQLHLSQDTEAEKETRLQYARWLADREAWEEAIGQCVLARDADTENALRRQYARILEEKEDYAGAAAQLEKLKDTAKETARLYALLTLREKRAGDFESAAAHLSKADAALLASEGVTAESLYRDWGFALAEEGDTAGAIKRLEKAGDSPEVLEKLSALQQALDTQRTALALAAFKEAPASEVGQNAAYETLRKTGEQFETLDGLLLYFDSLQQAGADLTKVFPSAPSFTGLKLPDFTPAEVADIDLSRPLVLWRQEYEYRISATDAFSSPYPLHENESGFQWKLLPDCWLRLPQDRRPRSLAECTCILLMDLTYPYLGQVSARTVSWDYVSLFAKKQSGSVSARATPWSKFYGNGRFPTFGAAARLLLWDPANNRAAVLDQWQQVPIASILPSSITVDWTTHSALSVSSFDLGLSAYHDLPRAEKALEEGFLALLEGGIAP